MIAQQPLYFGSCGDLVDLTTDLSGLHRMAQHGVGAFRLPRPTLVLMRGAQNAAEMYVLQDHTRSPEV